MRILILGAGGHAKVLREVFRVLNIGPVVLSEDDTVGPADAVVIGLGDLAKRRKLYQSHRPTLDAVHPSAVMAPDAFREGSAVQIMAGAVIQPGARIGPNTIINTRASVDHDCTVGAHSHIAPGATLCGGVTLGEGCFVGAGATIVQGVRIEAGTFVPAGTLVVGQTDFRKPVRAVRDV